MPGWILAPALIFLSLGYIDKRVRPTIILTGLSTQCPWALALLSTKNFMERLWTKLARWGRYFYLRVVRINAPAESIALGLALGVFSGALPFLSLQMVIAVSLAFVFRANVIAAALGTWWTNPFNWAIIFPLFNLLGKVFVPGEVVPVTMQELVQAPFFELIERGRQWLLITSLGGIIAGLPLAILTYFVSLRLIRAYRLALAQRKNQRLRREIHRD